MHYVTLFFKVNNPSYFAVYNDYYKYNYFLLNSGYIIHILQYLNTVSLYDIIRHSRYTFYSKRRIINNILNI